MSDAALNAELAELEAELDETPSRWNPEPGEKVSGLVTAVKYVQAKHGVMPVVMLRDGYGKSVEVAASRTMLKNRLAEAKVQPGDVLAICFTGDQVGASGVAFKGYEVRHKAKGARRPGEYFDLAAAEASTTVELTASAFGRTDDIPGF